MLEHVLRPGAIGQLALPHRIIMGAMHLGLEARRDGGAALAAFYSERVRGGAGLIVTGGSAISRVGAGGRNYSFINSPDDAPMLRHVASAVHDAGGLIALQLFHAGRYALPESFGLQPVAPSAIFSRFSRCEPVELSERQIRATIDDFGRGAARARELEFDAVEVMGSEGYLIDQFLAPLTNRRTDEWGGDRQRRTRFGLEVLAAIRRAIGADFPVVFRLSGAALIEDGPSEEDVAAFARALGAGGADALNVGVGWHESSIPTVQAIVPPGVWAPVAAAVKKAVGDLPVIASNRVNRLDNAEHILAAGEVDFVSMARPFLSDPALLGKARRGQPVNICIACNQACIDRSLQDAPVSCMVNPRAGREHDFPPAPMRRARTFAVVGGGPAGLQAAHTLASQGHRVDLYEASDALGGQFRLACRVPGKQDYGATIDYFTAELDWLGVRTQLRRPITAADVPMLRGYHGIVVASGVRPRRLDLPGVTLRHVLSYSDAFSAGQLGARVVIIGGGGIAVDLAHLASRPACALDAADRFRREHRLTAGAVPVDPPRAVTILQRGTRTGAAIGRSTRWAVLAELRQHKVRIHTGVTYQRITTEGVHILDALGTSRVVPAETVVIAAGQECDTVVPRVAAAAGTPYRLIGGARDVRGLDAVRAFSEGLTAGHDLVAIEGSPETQPVT